MSVAGEPRFVVELDALRDGADDAGAGARKSSHIDPASCAVPVGGLFCIGGGGVAVPVGDGASPKSSPPRRSMSVGALGAGAVMRGTKLDPLPLVVRDPSPLLGGGAKGAGSGAGLDDSIDSRLAICSPRPGSILSRSPTSWSAGSDNEGTSERNVKSSAESSRSLLSTFPSADGTGVLFRPSLPKKRETADGPAAGAGVVAGEVDMPAGNAPPGPDDAAVMSTRPFGGAGPKSLSLNDTGRDGAGEAGREVSVRIDADLLTKPALTSDEEREIEGAVGDLTSRAPPPDVVSCRSRGGGFRQKDHLLPDVSGLKAGASSGGASGSPSLNRVSQGESASRGFMRRGLRATESVKRDVDGVGLGRERA